MVSGSREKEEITKTTVMLSSKLLTTNSSLYESVNNFVYVHQLVKYEDQIKDLDNGKKRTEIRQTTGRLAQGLY
jgi:hypothetical protein